MPSAHTEQAERAYRRLQDANPAIHHEYDYALGAAVQAAIAAITPPDVNDIHYPVELESAVTRDIRIVLDRGWEASSWVNRCHMAASGKYNHLIRGGRST